MTIQVGDSLPEGQVKQLIDGSPTFVSVKELFQDKKGVLFAVPGAFTPGCSKIHLPSYLNNIDKIHEQGFEVIACMAVNDAWVMNAWEIAQNVDGKILMLADGSADYTKALGMELDLSAAGMGIRSHRFSMVVENNVIQLINIDERDISATVANATCGI